MMARRSQMALASVLLTIAPLGVAQQETAKPERDKTTAAEVHKETGDVVEAIKNYSADKREEAAKQAKAALDVLDAEIAALERRIDANWDKMDRAAREQANATLQALRKQRIEAAEWYGSLKNSTAEAWEHMKKGFTDAYRTLRSSWEKAAGEYKENGKQK